MTFNNETVSRQNLRAGNIAKSMTSKGNSGCLPITKISGKSGWKVNGHDLLGLPNGKYPGATEHLKR